MDTESGAKPGDEFTDGLPPPDLSALDAELDQLASRSTEGGGAARQK